VVQEVFFIAGLLGVERTTTLLQSERWRRTLWNAVRR